MASSIALLLPMSDEQREEPKPTDLNDELVEIQRKQMRFHSCRRCMGPLFMIGGAIMVWYAWWSHSTDPHDLPSKGHAVTHVITIPIVGLTWPFFSQSGLAMLFAGFGLLALGVWCLFQGSVFLLKRKMRHQSFMLHHEQDVHRKLWASYFVRPSGGLSSASEEPDPLSALVVTAPLGFEQYLAFLAMIGQCALNVLFYGSNYQSLPPRDYYERLNLLKHIVSLVEISAGCGALVFGCLMLLMGLRLRRKGEKPSIVAGMCESSMRVFKFGGKFSCLKLVKGLNIVKSGTSTKEAASSNYHVLALQGKHLLGVRNAVMVALASVFVRLVIISIGFFGLIVKLNQVDFMDKVSPINWTLIQFIKALGFANNLASIVDHDFEQHSALANAFSDEADRDATTSQGLGCRYDAWRTLIWSTLLQEKGFFCGLVVASTLSSSQHGKLLVGSRPFQVDETVVATEPCSGSVPCGTLGKLESLNPIPTVCWNAMQMHCRVRFRGFQASLADASGVYELQPIQIAALGGDTPKVAPHYKQVSGSAEFVLIPYMYHQTEYPSMISWQLRKLSAVKIEGHVAPQAYGRSPAWSKSMPWGTIDPCQATGWLLSGSAKSNNVVCEPEDDSVSFVRWGVSLTQIERYV